jgi:hypothetical protein
VKCADTFLGKRSGIDALANLFELFFTEPTGSALARPVGEAVHALGVVAFDHLRSSLP